MTERQIPFDLDSHELPGVRIRKKFDVNGKFDFATFTIQSRDKFQGIFVQENVKQITYDQGVSNDN